VHELTELIQEARALLIGPIRQELLSGVSDARQFKDLRDRLRAFTDLSIHGFDYERAAEFYNSCRHAGVQGSHMDFLICSIAAGNGAAIFTLDKDFSSYAKHIPITLHEARAQHAQRLTGSSSETAIDKADGRTEHIHVDHGD
jgi:predicted nucleic acid-binding protein